MSKKNRNPIKQGSWVKIVIPKFVERVGYPHDLKYYSSRVESKHGDAIRNLISTNTENKWFEFNDWRSTRAFEEILQTLAWRAAHADKWGGKERSIHLIDRPELFNAEGWAVKFKRCVTGIYSPGFRSGGYEYDEWEPPYLYNQKHHRLVRLTGVGMPSDLWIPDYHLQLLK